MRAILNGAQTKIIVRLGACTNKTANSNYFILKKKALYKIARINAIHLKN